MRFRTKRALKAEPKSEGSEQAGTQPVVPPPDPEDDVDTSQLTAREARQRIQVSETTIWRYSSGIW